VAITGPDSSTGSDIATIGAVAEGASAGATVGTGKKDTVPNEVDDIVGSFKTTGAVVKGAVVKGVVATKGTVATEGINNVDPNEVVDIVGSYVKFDIIDDDGDGVICIIFIVAPVPEIEGSDILSDIYKENKNYYINNFYFTM